MYITKHTINLCKTSDDGRMTRMKLNEFYYKKFTIESIYQKKECGILVLYFQYGYL